MSPEMTKEQCKAETEAHIGRVRGHLNRIIIELSDRSIHHDESKLESPEFEVFCKYTPLLAELDYGSKEYKDCLAEMTVAIDHHYKHNRHHPEHYPTGWREMNLIDLLEMVCDWVAATKRHNNGNIYKSLDINRKRFKMPVYLIQILRNTVQYLQAAEAEEDG